MSSNRAIELNETPDLSVLNIEKPGWLAKGISRLRKNSCCYDDSLLVPIEMLGREMSRGLLHFHRLVRLRRFSGLGRRGHHVIIDADHPTFLGLNEKLSQVLRSML